MTPVILAGGSGTRLWPLSRDSYPKQFRSFSAQEEDSLFIKTLKRVQVARMDAPIVVCHHRYRFLVAEQLRIAGVKDAVVLLEPEAKNTAPALALAMLYVRSVSKTTGSDQFLVLPSDHEIEDEKAWHDAISVGQNLLGRGYVVCLGAEPTQGDSNYGYIQRGEPLNKDVYEIAAFKEKPEPELALRYVEDGNYYWNCGIFLMRGEDYLEALRKHQPSILSTCERSCANFEEDLGFLSAPKKSYARCPSISIDYAVMEKIDCGAVVPVACGWSDLGNWDTIWAAGDKDARGNVAQGDVLHNGCANTLLMSNSRLLTAINMEDTVVVETSDAVMVASKKRPQDVKILYEQLHNLKRDEASGYDREYRPWGYFEVLARGDQFQVKMISVNPGERLSLQLHQHRAEHWVVVEGRASVECEERKFTLEVDQSTYIPLGSKHRLGNDTDKPLRLIEIQSGSYLGEDDIVRFDDSYGR